MAMSCRVRQCMQLISALEGLPASPGFASLALEGEYLLPSV